MVKKTLFGLVLILSVVTGWAFLTGLGLERTFFSVDYYHAVIDEIDGENLRDYFLAVDPPDFEGRGVWDEAVIYRTLVRVAGEEWLKERAAYAVEEYLLFVTGEQEELVIEIDLLEHQSVFWEALEEELGERYPELLGELGPQLLEEIVSRFGLPTELTWVELDSTAELEPGFRAELERINRVRANLRTLPWISFAVLLVAGFLWLKPGGAFIALGLGVFLSGASYYYLWPRGWEAVVGPYIEELAADQGLLELIWAREGPLFFSIAAGIFNRVALYGAVFGVAVLVFGLFVEGCYRLVRGASGSGKRLS